eukprot:558825-Hanusia_phi.AAC.1
MLHPGVRQAGERRDHHDVEVPPGEGGGLERLLPADVVAGREALGLAEQGHGGHLLDGGVAAQLAALAHGGQAHHAMVDGLGVVVVACVAKGPVGHHGHGKAEHNPGDHRVL